MGLTKEHIAEVIKLHALWLTDDPKGEKATLSKADLRRVDLLRTGGFYSEYKEKQIIAREKQIAAGVKTATKLGEMTGAIMPIIGLIVALYFIF